MCACVFVVLRLVCQMFVLGEHAILHRMEHVSDIQ